MNKLTVKTLEIAKVFDEYMKTTRDVLKKMNEKMEKVIKKLEAK
jgi:hypothetical protein